ncbi:hypothetical protein [Streptomyces europaeiscabiei]|uniref:hypothetical protein n=1 Tax=Streptomyces europaeiscabiei TaxID=146819 RepID=UPI0029BBCA72|nr:hypothetical protein [Streptomyces europaeiscabiei]MDX3584201.1 hypothetical protein [Streptomyces europaeiscabiei]
MSQKIRKVRQRCEAVVAALRLPPEAGLEEVCGLVADRLGRPVHTLTMPLGGVASGMTILLEQELWICADQDTSAWHQAHVKLHELGHLLMGHEQEAAVTEEALTLWTPSLNTGVAMRHMGIGPVFQRHHAYDKPAEMEAEIVASLLEERMSPNVASFSALQGRAENIAATLGPALQHTPRGARSRA